ncbi:MAG: PAS domain S-box protein [Deltaproteobacteria bacterium]|nr:PAS domain S-box protein [Deltaproteobacteria bacterium]
MSFKTPPNNKIRKIQSEELLRIFIQYTPVAVALFDREMRYLAHSKRWVIDFDLGEEDLVGLSHYDVFPEIPPEWKEEHKRCLAGKIIKKEEEQFPRKDGSVDWVRRELHPWYDHTGRVGGLIMFSEVITERKKEQEALRTSGILGSNRLGET